MKRLFSLSFFLPSFLFFSSSSLSFSPFFPIAFIFLPSSFLSSSLKYKGIKRQMCCSFFLPFPFLWFHFLLSPSLKYKEIQKQKMSCTFSFFLPSTSLLPSFLSFLLLSIAFHSLSCTLFCHFPSFLPPSFLHSSFLSFTHTKCPLSAPPTERSTYSYKIRCHIFPFVR